MDQERKEKILTELLNERLGCDTDLIREIVKIFWDDNFTEYEAKHLSEFDKDYLRGVFDVLERV